MRTTKIIALLAGLLLSTSMWTAPAFADETIPQCQTTNFYRDGMNLTAAVIASGDVTGQINATGCDIGVYVPSGVTGVTVTGDVSGAKYFGVLVDDGSASVTGATIHDIGDSPLFDGAQHGVGIYFTNGATGSVENSTVDNYQKGGIVASGNGTNVTISGNTVTGLGPVNFIAQNGIQVSYGAVGTVRGNNISDNFYTGTVGVGPNSGGQNPPGWQYISAGLLLYQAGPGTDNSMNHFSANQRNVAVVP